MKRDLDVSILSLDWASKIMGPYLDTGALCLEVMRFLRSQLPRRKLRILIWDESHRRYSQEASSARKTVSSRPRITPDALKAVRLKEPLVSKADVYLPLRLRERFLGVLIVEFAAWKDKNLQEHVLFLSRMAATILSNGRLFIDSEVRNQDMFRFNVLSRALNPTVNGEDVLKILAEGLEGILAFDICGMLIQSKEKHILFIKSKVKLHPRTVEEFRNNLLELLLSLTRNPLDVNKLKERTVLVQGSASFRKIASSLNAPLITKDKVIGVICLGSFAREFFSVRDQQNINTLAAHGAVAFENAMLYEGLRKTYFSIINALTSAIEAKDEYTQGHSVLVSKYAVAIAQSMGLSAVTIESIQIAGLLHDLGKIGVPEEILVKKGKLTEEEYEVVKSHPEIAMKILGPVEFPHFTHQESLREASPELTLSLFEEADLSEDVKLMIYHHHEKFGGGGYPKGIRADEIPLGARILSVADTFEALTADRPYRKAFPVDEAKKILQQISGEQLDPEIAKIFVGIIDEKGLETLRGQPGF